MTKKTVMINNVEYKHDSYYDLLGRDDNGSVEHPAVACPKCHNVEFKITYGDYKCIANCKCGHSMTVYDG